MKKLYILPLLVGGLMVTSCENGDNEFNDFDYQTVYFANQYVNRTVELGVDEKVDLTTDNLHQITIQAAWGGGYQNRNNVLIDYVIDPTLVNDLYFKNTDVKLEVMPSSYYTIPEDMKLRIPAGEIRGGVTVQLNDEFFNDPKSVSNCYVIPLRMTSVEGADSILCGKASQENPVLTNDSHWAIQPKNFVLYGVKFVNPWHGQYKRRGVDQITIDGQTSTIVRHDKDNYVERDEDVDVTTTAYTKNVLPITVKDAAGNDVTFNITLTFGEDNSCTLSSDADNVGISGSGKFVAKGEKNSLGGKDRDAIYLEYTADLRDANIKVATKDTLVLKTRNVQGGAALGVERR